MPLTTEQLNDMESRILRLDTSPADVREAGTIFTMLWRRQSECLRWASAIIVGPGGYPRNVVQQVLSAAARGEDSKALRDHLMAKRANAAEAVAERRGSGGRSRR